MTKKTKPKLVQPKMYISDRPAKPRKKKTTANSTVKNSFNNTGKEFSSQRVNMQENPKREHSKGKSKSKKKKKVLVESKRLSNDSEPNEHLKSGLIQASKFSTFEQKRIKDKELASILDPSANEITVRE